MHASVAGRRAVATLSIGMGLLVVVLTSLSLHWPLIGDAAIFHFAAGQFLMGAVPYRDLFEMNLPLIYGLHAAIILVGGMGDLAFRIFDLGCLMAVATLAAALVWPAGRGLALLAAFTIAASHLLSGPAAAGQRDFLLLIPALAAALCAVRSAEQPGRAIPWLVATGLALGIAALLKPTAILLITLPVLARGFRWRDACAVLAGGAAIGLMVLPALAALGSIGWFVADLRVFGAYYAQMANRTIPALIRIAAQNGVLGTGGLAVAAVFGLRHLQSPRARVMIGLTVFGALHFIVQRKGFFYHADPLIAALACLGAWSLGQMPRRPVFAVLAATAILFAARGVTALRYTRPPGDLFMPAPASLAMQAALQSHLPPGARVQMLDMSGGAFIAMARAGMRQATPHAYWMFLASPDSPWRAAFITGLHNAQPDAILVTNSSWPVKQDFTIVDDWPALNAELACCYPHLQSGTVEAPPSPWEASAPSVSWRLYLRNAADPPR